jgi:uncharacterized membrane protein
MEEVGSTVPQEEKPMGGASKIINLFFEPKKVFASLKIKPTWLIPFIIVSLLGMVYYYYAYPFIMGEQIAKIEANEKIPAEQKGAIIEKMQGTGHPPAWQLGISPIGALFYLAIASAVLFFIFNVLLGGDSTFRKVFSVYCYSGLVGIPATVVKLPLTLVKKSTDVQTNLALLLSPDAKGSFLYSIFSSFDIFVIWQVILISMGMAVVYKFTPKKSYTTVFVLWIIWVFLKSGLSSLLGGMFSF